MAYFVTGATGFIGRFLVEQLLERDGDVHVLVREGSQEKLDALRERWDDGGRVKRLLRSPRRASRVPPRRSRSTHAARS